jgi:N-acetylglutamate synthase-like GNAT family acetyltransferase
MKIVPDISIIDCTVSEKYEKYLYKCLAPMPFRRYSRRRQYLQRAIPDKFHKKLLVFKGEVVGSIEYASPRVSGYPISGSDLIVMNCVWVLRRAKGHHFGKVLVEEMLRNERTAAGFATIALENHWSPWFKKRQIEKLGFKSVDSVKVAHKKKRKDHVFNIHLMWMPRTRGAKPPIWDIQKLLDGEVFCMAHPLYRTQDWKGSVFELG